ncbi:MAG: isopentenyl-diphosphate delta-isomerase [Candidatus Beckwithbacteria bacterium]|nr:isopentenyl-diphosphate delta-isomerase [Candidatus Beckwithbacteria bacterium]
MRRLIKPIQVSGTVISGEKIGRKIGFPTANLNLKQSPKIIPGVYVAVCRLAKKSFLGLAYYGPRYIFGHKQNSFEVYLFNFRQQIYEKMIQVKLLKFLRPPKPVKKLIELKKLLEADVVNLNDQVILVNRKDQILGIEDKIRAHLGHAKLHRAISVQLFNQKGKLLIQQRAKTKSLFAGEWANTVCTDVRPYETYLQAAQRRLKEEFGLTTQLKPIFKFTYSARGGKAGSEREMDQVFLGLVRGRPRPNPLEIADWQFISLTAAKTKRADFTPWFQLILKKLKPSDIVVS